MSPLDMLSALLVMVIWGLNFVVVKVGVTEIPPLLLTSLRFFCVGLMVAPFFCFPRRHLGKVLLLSTVMGVFHFSFMFVGLSGVDAAAAAIAIQLGVPFSSLLALLFFKDKLGWRRGLGMVMAFGGVVLLAGEPHLKNAVWLLFIVAAALAWAVGNVISKKLGDLSPMLVNGYLGLFAAPQILIVSLIFESGQSQAIADAGVKGYGALAYVVIFASLIAYTLWYRLIGRYDLNQIVPFSMLGPVFGIVAGVVLLGEPITWHKMIGGAITLAGVGIIQWREVKKAQKPDIIETPT